MKLDYSITDPAERVKVVEAILAETPEPTEDYLQILSDYIALCLTKEERQGHTYLTVNRQVTLDKRETSLDGLIENLENGEDGLYNIAINDKNRPLTKKPSITQHDIDAIPGLKQITDTIETCEKALTRATGRSAYVIKQMIIDLYKDRYIVKSMVTRPIATVRTYHEDDDMAQLHDEVISGFDMDGLPIYTGFSLMNANICSHILINYSSLYQDCFEKLDKDMIYILWDFDRIAEKALADYPILSAIVERKIDGATSAEIQLYLQEHFNIKYSIEYLSSLWRNKIPKIIASAAEDEFLSWYYLNVERGSYKRCSRCGEIKLALPKYFNRNSTSKDGLYSICKQCRRKGSG